MDSSLKLPKKDQSRFYCDHLGNQSLPEIPTDKTPVLRLVHSEVLLFLISYPMCFYVMFIHPLP